MIPMLKEEAFHMFTGHEGIKRVIRAGRVPLDIVQKYLNRWISVSFDLFGVDHSSSAHWFYVWGLKGRFDEGTAGDVDRDHINEYNRLLYRKECDTLVGQFNRFIPKDAPPLYVPDLKFNRSIGEFKGRRFTVKGEPLTESEWEKYEPSVLPTDEDNARLAEILKEPDWIDAPSKEMP